MRNGLLVTALSFSIVAFWSCGKKDDKKNDIAYQSCAIPNLVGNSDFGLCLESENSTDIKSICEDYKGTYAGASCDVPAGTLGCKYSNQNGVTITNWYKGSAWIQETVKTECAKEETKGTIVTK